MSEIHFPAAEIVRLPSITERRPQGERRSQSRPRFMRDDSSETQEPGENSDASPRQALNASQGSIDVIA